MHCWWCHVMIMWSSTWLTWLWSCDLVHLKSWFIALRSCSAWSSGKISNSIEGKEILHLMEMTVVSESISLYSPRETHPISNMTHTICQNLQKQAQNFGIRILSEVLNCLEYGFLDVKEFKQCFFDFIAGICTVQNRCLGPNPSSLELKFSDAAPFRSKDWTDSWNPVVASPGRIPINVWISNFPAYMHEDF